MKDQYDDLQQSYGRCLRAGGFIERFYESFLASHEDIELAFSRTDFQKQRLALRRGISVAISHAAGSYLSKRSFDQMAAVHSRNGTVPVAPELYQYWLESLIAAVREKDPLVNEDLILRWRTAMAVVIFDFVGRY